MFEISEETKAKVIVAIREVLKRDGVADAHLTDEVIGETVDVAIAVVKEQFGF